MCTRHFSSFSLLAALLCLGPLATSGCALDAEGTAAVETKAPPGAPADDRGVDESASWAAGSSDRANSARALDQGLLPAEPNSARALDHGFLPADPNSARALDHGFLPAEPNSARALDHGFLPADPNSARSVDDGSEVVDHGPNAPADDDDAQIIDSPAAPIATRDDGYRCSADWECASDFCDDGICATPSDEN